MNSRIVGMEGGTSESLHSTFPSPVATAGLAVHTNDGLGLHDCSKSQASGSRFAVPKLKTSDQPEVWSLGRTVQSVELLPQGEISENECLPIFEDGENGFHGQWKHNNYDWQEFLR